MAESAIKNTILIAIDDSKQAEEAFEFYADHLHKEGNTLLLVHGAELDTTVGVHRPLNRHVWTEMMEIEAKQVEKLNRKYMAMMREKNLPGKIKMVRDCQKPWITIVNEAKTNGASMVVMGTRGMGVVRRTLLGSVSDDVLHHAPCPVVICKSQTL